MVDSYNQYIQQRRELRHSIDEKIAHKATILEDCMTRFAEDGGQTFISVREFIGMPLGERQYVNKGVYFVPVEFGEKVWSFFCHISPGYVFGLQDHDVKETCFVIKGVLIDSLNKKKYRAGEFVSWPKGKKHKPGSDEGCMLLVEFNITELEDYKNLTPAKT